MSSRPAGTAGTYVAVVAWVRRFPAPARYLLCAGLVLSGGLLSLVPWWLIGPSFVTFLLFGALASSSIFMLIVTVTVAAKDLART